MKVWLPCLFNVFLVCYGIFMIRKEAVTPDSPACFIAVQNQEDVIEFIVRAAIKRIRVKGLPRRLVVLTGDSSDRTTIIVTKMSQQMSFIVREINSVEVGACHFLDLRQRRDIGEIHRLLTDFLEWDTPKRQRMTE